MNFLTIAMLLGIPGLENPGFEDASPLEAWKTWVFKEGKDPTIRLDDRGPKEGKQCLLVEAQDPADVALGQVVSLPPGTLWRATGWIKTQDLLARDRTQVGAALHMQTPDGATLSTGDSRFGTSPWRETEVFFRVPPAGEVKVVLFFIGYGKGTGKVWFDGLRLEEATPKGPEAVRILNEKLGKLPVDGKQCGQFIEPLCYLLPSMLAQQVESTSFEEDPPWRNAYKAGVDRPHRPWYPDGAVHVAKYSLDPSNPFNGARSQKIDLPVKGARAGISQDGYYLQEGRTYRLRLHMRSEGDVPVRAWLHGGGGTVAGPEPLGRAGSTWKGAEVKLRALRSVENSTLTIDFEGPGTLWLDRVYLIGDDAVLGLWRPDVVEALREMKPGIIRFGGSAILAYEWDKCIGSWDERAPFLSPYWGGIEENFVGVEEFVQLCREVGAEPLVCLRWLSQKPEEAAAELEYFNGPPESPWGIRRARNGRREPYRVKYWQIGNEVGGAEYDATLVAFAGALRKVDPDIKILSSFPSERTLELGAGLIDYLCPHHYGCADLGAMARDFDSLEEQIKRRSAAGKVRVAVTEWNTTAGDWGLARGSLQTLSNALSCSRYHNLLIRRADLVEITIRSNLVDSFGSGAILTGPGWLYVSPAYHAQGLYARAAGSYPVRIERSPKLPWNVEEPDLSAALSPDGKTLRVYGVNSTGEALEVKVRLDGFSGGVRRGMLHVLKDREGPLSAEGMNSRDDPARIAVSSRPAALSGGDVVLEFGPLSLSLYELEMGG